MTDPTVLYLDASAIAKLLLDEPGADALQVVIAGAAQRATSIVSLVEVPRAVARRRRPLGPGELDGAVRALSVIGIDRMLAASAASLEPPALRTLDAIHLASALVLGDDLAAFLTYDRRLAEAAAAAGMRVASPGSEPAPPTEG